MYTVSPFVRSLFSILASVGIVAISFAPVFVAPQVARADHEGYKISVTSSPTVIGQTVTIGGNSSAHYQTGNDNTQKMSVDWGDGTGWHTTPGGGGTNNGLSFSPSFTNHTQGNKSFIATWVAEKTLAPGEYHIIVSVHHAEPQGKDGSAEATAHFDIIIPPVAGSITIVKEVTGDEAGSWSFDFIGDLGSFSLTDGDTSNENTDLDAGAYTVDEDISNLPSGWSFTGIDCGDADVTVTDNSVDINLGEGENVVCTFTNNFVAEPTTGSLKVNKITLGDNDGTFTVKVVETDATDNIITTSGSGSITFNDLLAGFYSIIETILPSEFWAETDNDCDDIEVVAGETSECTITNTFTPPLVDADLEITKTVDVDGSVSQGDEVTYTITVTNLGPDTANNVVVIEDLPACLTLVGEPTSSQGSFDFGTGEWLVGTLEDDESATLEITVTVDCDTGSIIENTASADADEDDSDGLNNNYSALVTVTPACSDGLDNDSDGQTDFPNDLGCENADDNDETDAPPPPPPPSGGGGPSGGGSLGGGGSLPTQSQGQVLGASTDECSAYIEEYIKFGAENNPVEVSKLQTFLNSFEAFSLVINGIYDEATHAAIHAFQVKYLGDIMLPWGATRSSGFVYITTVKKINEIFCQFNTEFPLSSQQEAEIARVRALGDAWQPGGSNSQNSNGSVGGQVQLPTTPSAPQAPTIIPEVGASSGNAAQSAATANAPASNSWWGSFWNWLFGN